MTKRDRERKSSFVKAILKSARWALASIPLEKLDHDCGPDCPCWGKK